MTFGWWRSAAIRDSRKKRCAEALVPSKLGREDLQRDASPAPDVLSEKDGARRAVADQALDPEVGDQRPSLDLGRHLP